MPAVEAPRGRRTGMLIGGGVAVLVVIATVVGVVMRTRGDSTTDGSLSVQLLAADDAGPDPFTPSVATADLTVTRQFAASKRAGSTGGGSPADGGGGAATIKAHTGDEAGLHGATSDPACDQATLASALADDPAKAEGWAEAAGIPTDQLTGYLGGLAPAVLATDTMVTNHGWASGKVTSFQSVLEGGTPVLLDSSGTPRVRCACGNPVGPADVQDDTIIELDGATWAGFDPGALTIVQPSTAPVERLQLTDVGTGAPVEVPVGGTVLDGYLVAGPEGVSVVDGARVTRIVDQPAQSAFEDGSGGIIYVPAWSDFQPTTADQATVWRLASGVATPTKVLTSDEPTRAWPKVHGVVVLGGRNLLLYEQITQTPGDEQSIQGELHALDLDSGQDTTVPEGGSHYLAGMWSVTSSGERLAWLSSADELYSFVDAVDANLTRPVDLGWAPFGTDIAAEPNRPCDKTVPPSCPYEFAFIDDSSMVATAVGDPPAYPLSVFVVDLRNGGGLRPVATISNPPQGRRHVSVDGDTAVVSFAPFNGPQAPAVAIDLKEGTVAELAVTGFVTFIDVPIRRPGPATTPTTTVSTAGPATPTTPAVDPQAIRKLDLRNATYSIPEEGGYCPGGSMTLADGRWTGSETAGQAPSLWMTQDPVYGDLTGDGVEDAAGLFSCSGGGSGFSQMVIVTTDAAAPRQLAILGVGGWGVDQAAGLTIADGQIVVDMQRNETSSCCAEGPHYEERYGWDGTAWVKR